ncbi:hypothetical protein G7Y79_00009g026140 [Physcia stellaris]|nr:hypothetical protein G7Y79_00009g026140 [Physcia stellaris]
MPRSIRWDESRGHYAASLLLNMTKRLCRKIKGSASAEQSNSTTSDSMTITLDPPSATEILRYRYQYGVNLGSIFVLERWLSPDMFDDSCTGDSELDAVQASIRVHGLEATRQKWEQHWTSALTDKAINFIADRARCNAVRLPIGYFTLGAAFTEGTSFADVAAVYLNAWSTVQKYCSRLHAHGIGTLIDFHALPGGQNDETHSGAKECKKWSSITLRDQAKSCVVFVANAIKNGDLKGCIGIQLANEPKVAISKVQTWYNDVLKAVEAVDSSIPIYVSDACGFGRALAWTARANKVASAVNPLIITRPEYFTFTEGDNLLSGPALMATLQSRILQHLPATIGDVANHGACQVCISGYSCALPWNAEQAVQPSGPEEVRYTFGRKQCEKWREMTNGAFFWTWLPYKESQGVGPKGWGFKEMIDCDNLVPPEEFMARARDIERNVQGAKDRMVAMRKRAAKKHERYCERRGAYEWEHWRFEAGFTQGFNDACAFYTCRSLLTPTVASDPVSRRASETSQHYPDSNASDTPLLEPSNQGTNSESTIPDNRLDNPSLDPTSNSADTNIIDPNDGPDTSDQNPSSHSAEPAATVPRDHSDNDLVRCNSHSAESATTVPHDRSDNTPVRSNSNSAERATTIPPSRSDDALVRSNSNTSALKVIRHPRKPHPFKPNPRPPLGADRIGALELWIRKRIADWLKAGADRRGANGGKRGRRNRERLGWGYELVWEYEKGFRKGVEGFEWAVDIVRG